MKLQIDALGAVVQVAAVQFADDEFHIRLTLPNGGQLFSAEAFPSKEAAIQAIWKWAREQSGVETVH